MLYEDYKEKFTYDIIYDEYINKNRTEQEIILDLGIPYKQFKRLLLEYNINKSKDLIDKHKKAISIERYGTEFPSQSENIKNKTKTTCLQKYGSVSPMQNDLVKIKSKNSLLKNYGVDHPSKSQAILNKKARSVSAKYGVDNVLKVDTIKSQIRNTCLQKYGTDNPAKSDIVKAKTIATNLQKYGKMYPNQNTELQLIKSGVVIKNDTNIDIDTDTESIKLDNYIHEIINFLHNNSINNIMLSEKEIDIYLPDYNLGIEFNENYWHSELYCEKMYHINKSLEANKQGVFIYHIFEYEFADAAIKEKILEHLLSILKIRNSILYGRSCTLREISSEEKQKFLDLYHIQGNDKSQINVGLYHDNELVSVMTFCKSRFNSNYKYELSRYAVKSKTTVLGGAEKLFSYFVKTYMASGDEIITYNDISKTTGNIYPRLGFKFKHRSKPSYVWFKPNCTEIKTRYQAQMKNEVEIMHSNGYYRIYDCGNNAWTFKKTEN